MEIESALQMSFWYNRIPLSLSEHWNAVKHNLVVIPNNGTKQQLLASLSNRVDLKNSRHRRIHGIKTANTLQQLYGYFCLLLNGGDVEVNPDPESVRPCKLRKVVTLIDVHNVKKWWLGIINAAFVITALILDMSNAPAQEFNPKFVFASIPKEWVCPKCIGSVLPFYAHDLSDDISNNSENEVTHDIHLQALTDREKTTEDYAH